MHRVLVAVRTELLQFNPVRRITTILGSGVTRNPWRPLVGIRPTLSTFQRDDDTDSLCCHNLARSLKANLDTNYYFFIRRPTSATKFLILLSSE